MNESLFPTNEENIASKLDAYFDAQLHAKILFKREYSNRSEIFTSSFISWN